QDEPSLLSIRLPSVSNNLTTDTPVSASVNARYGETLSQSAEIRDYVAGAGDDIARETAIANGEAHIQKYGMSSYLEWAGGEDNARVVFGDTRFEQLALEDAEKQNADRTIRSAK
ncbi:MAG: hypothetical protein AAFN91_11025, partial [Pseudomonadota bacterium]